MKEYKNIVRFSFVSIRDNIHNVMFYLVLVVMFCAIQFLCADVGSYLHNTHDRMNIFEIYIWFMARRSSQIIYILGLIFLLCGTNFFHTGASYYLLRTNRRNWIFSQLLYLFILVIGFNLFILISFWISCKGAITIEGIWSNAAYIAAQTWTEDIGILSFIMVDFGLLKHNPNVLGIITFFLQLLAGIFTGMLLIAFQAKGKMAYGIMVVGVLWFTEVMFEFVRGFPAIAYMTPYRLTRISQLSLNNSGPSVFYAFCYLLLLFWIMETILLKLSKTVDFVKME